MKVLVVGSGGREHMIAKTLLRGKSTAKVICAPGNPGIERSGFDVVDVEMEDQEGLVQLALEQEIDLVIVGPEKPLTEGLIDAFAKAGIPAFGPNASAARIEGSKEFAKEVMTAANVPTAAYRCFSDYDEAAQYVISKGAPIVVKADGLAAGKGVVVATTVDQALEALAGMLRDNRFGDAGARVVVEEFLEGQEFSLMAFVAGEDVYPMVIAQDHKAAYDGDTGPNTGGMGAYSPVPQIDDSTLQTAVETVLKPVATQMVAQGDPFTGILYAGLIATEAGPKVIEFNARFGDPEAQVILPRLDGDLGEIALDLLQGRKPKVAWHEDLCCVGVVVAADGYPGPITTGAPLPKFSGTDVDVLYSGVAEGDEGALVSAGGRVYLVSGTAKSLAAAQEKVYAALRQAKTPLTFYRTDIGNRGITKR